MIPDWKCKSFNELSVVELYAILRLRNEVFVVEQNCVYQDADDKDATSHHLAGWAGNTLVAYCRLLPPGVSYSDASIGRVVTSPAFRNLGHGQQLLTTAIACTRRLFNCNTITISAQLYLKAFYEGHGFVQVSDTYLEDNIAHIKMQLTI